VSGRPLVTICILAYNQEKFIREAIEGALNQTYEPLEIVISDDCSTDQTYEIISEVASGYTGKKSIILNRNKKNLGIGAQINKTMDISHGELIIANAGDDISLSHRVEKIVDGWIERGRKSFSIYSSMTVIDEKGNELGRWAWPPTQDMSSVTRMIESNKWRIHGCTHAWHRDVFDRFGPISNNVWHEDRLIPVRSRILGEIQFIEEPLMKYRIHCSNYSNVRVGGNLSNENQIERRIGFLRKFADLQKNHYKDINFAFQNRMISREVYLHIINILLWRVLLLRKLVHNLTRKGWGNVSDVCLLYLKREYLDGLVNFPQDVIRMI